MNYCPNCAASTAHGHDRCPECDEALTDQEVTASNNGATYMYLDVSTGHISKETMDWLSESPDGIGYTIAPYTYGAFVTVPDDCCMNEAMVTTPVDLSLVMNHARTLGCSLIRLDSDGAQIEGLDTYDW